MTQSAPRIVVVGSINLDIVARVPRLPAASETVIGDQFEMFAGGKGANQAVGAARLGAHTTMIGRLGDDAYGRFLLESLAAEGINTITVQFTPDAATGVALVGVDAEGQNAIMVIPGANSLLSPDDILAHEAQIATADVMLLQLEVPIETSIAALRLAQRHHVTTILDPAPAPATGLLDELLEVDVLTPNRTEAEQITGQSIVDVATAELVAHQMQARGARQVVITMGAEGALYVDRDCVARTVDACQVDVVDTTAAGDAFTSALAVGLATHGELTEAVELANIAGALAATRHGAQASLPRRAEIQPLLQR